MAKSMLAKPLFKLPVVGLKVTPILLGAAVAVWYFFLREKTEASATTLTGMSGFSNYFRG